MAVKITCIKKDNGFHENRYTAITDLGWINEESNVKGLSTRLQIYDYIKQGGEAYVSVNNNIARLITAETPRGVKYVKTVSDETLADNLLALPECR